MAVGFRFSVSTVLCLPLLVACDLAPSSLCTPERDPGGLYCDGGGQFIHSARAARSAGGTSGLLRLESSIADTMTPDGHDFEFRVLTYDPDSGNQTFYTIDNLLRSRRTYFEPLECDRGFPALDSRDIVPRAVAHYEAEVGPLVLDATTRFAFRQVAGCIDPSGEDQIHVAYRRWHGESPEAWFVRFDRYGDFTDVVGPCDDFWDAASCL